MPLSVVKGVSEAAAHQIVQERLTGGKYTSVEDFYDRVGVKRDALDRLAKAGAFNTADV